MIILLVQTFFNVSVNKEHANLRSQARFFVFNNIIHINLCIFPTLVDYASLLSNLKRNLRLKKLII